MRQVYGLVQKAKEAMLELGDTEKYIVFDPAADDWKFLSEQPLADVSHWLVKSAGDVMVHLAAPNGTYTYHPVLALSFTKEF